MKLILGLGNPGPQYSRTRHNAGFMVIDRLADDLAATWSTEPKFKAEVAAATLENGQKVILAKPLTMMNLSGEAAQRLVQFYKLTPADVWAVFDELDVPFGRLRLRRGGSGGGHQGVNSLIQHLGADFTRVRVGISLNDRNQEPSETYVLRPFNAHEQTHLPAVIHQAATIINRQLQLDTPTETTFELY